MISSPEIFRVSSDQPEVLLMNAEIMTVYMHELKIYIEENRKYPVRTEPVEFSCGSGNEVVKALDYTPKDAKNLEEIIREMGETFHEMLFRKIDEQGMTDAEVYKRANLDRKLFSKIRCNPAYHSRKNTVLALAVALKLDLDETVELLGKAGYAFSPGSKGDLIVKYFIERGVYDIQVINYALYEFDQPLLG